MVGVVEVTLRMNFRPKGKGATNQWIFAWLAGQRQTERRESPPAQQPQAEHSKTQNMTSSQPTINAVPDYEVPSWYEVERTSSSTRTVLCTVPPRLLVCSYHVRHKYAVRLRCSYYVRVHVFRIFKRRYMGTEVPGTFLVTSTL